jgi:hypothetical protein
MTKEITVKLPKGWEFCDVLEAQREVSENVTMSVAPRYVGRGVFDLTKWDVLVTKQVADIMPTEENDWYDGTETLKFTVTTEVDSPASWRKACVMAFKQGTKMIKEAK